MTIQARLEPSQALLAANQRLLRLREAYNAGISSSPPPVCAAPAAAPTSQQLPAHLGWHSPAVTAALRSSGAAGQGAAEQTCPECSRRQEKGEETCLPIHTTLPNPESVTCLHPSLALAMLGQEQTAPGRLWLLLRYLDVAGSGQVTIEMARQAFTGKDASLRFCGWRQLRNLLRQGEGVFWQRDKRTIWLRSLPNVANSLGVDRLQGRPVALPVEVLTAGISTFRAHLYASFHAGSAGTPISRDTLTDLTGLSHNSQRSYEDQAKVQATPNFAIGPQLGLVDAQELHWEKGGAAFILTDHQGRRGPVGQQYHVWQLPNSYSASHALLPKGRQKALNQAVADLRIIRDAGNDHQQVVRFNRRYHPNGAAAASSFNRQPEMPAYWPSTRKWWNVLSRPEIS